MLREQQPQASNVKTVVSVTLSIYTVEKHLSMFLGCTFKAEINIIIIIIIPVICHISQLKILVAACWLKGKTQKLIRRSVLVGLLKASEIQTDRRQNSCNQCKNVFSSWTCMNVCEIRILCVHVCVPPAHSRVLGLKLSLGALNYKRIRISRDKRRLHSSSGTAQGSVLLSREHARAWSADQRIHSLTITQSFTVHFWLEIEKSISPLLNRTTLLHQYIMWEPRWCTKSFMQAGIRLVRGYQIFLCLKGKWAKWA